MPLIKSFLRTSNVLGMLASSGHTLTTMFRPLLVCSLGLAALGASAQSVAWIHAYENTFSWATSMARGGEGELYLGGRIRDLGDPFDGLPLVGYGYQDGFIAKTDGTGHAAWIHLIGAASSEYVVDVQERDGELTIAGNMVNSGSGSSINYNGGAYEIPYECCSNGYIMRLDTAGTLQWLFQPDGSPTDMHIDDAGDIHLVTLGDSMRYYRLSATGNGLMEFAFSDFSFSPQLAMAPDGDILIASAFSQTHWWAGATYTTHGNGDILLSRFDASGVLQFTKHIGSVGNDMVNDLHMGSDGALRMSGVLNGVVDYGGDTLAGAATRWFLATIDGTGDLLTLNDSTFSTRGATGQITENDAGETLVTINFTDTLIRGSDTLISLVDGGGYEAGGVIAKWNSTGQLSWYRALSVDTTDLIGHMSIRFGPLAADSIFICGLINEPVIVEGTLYNLPHDNIAYAGLLIDTTYAPIALGTAAAATGPAHPLLVVPNPSTSTALLQGVLPGDRVDVMDALGRCVLSARVATLGLRLDATTLPDGAYSIRVRNEGEGTRIARWAVVR